MCTNHYIMQRKNFTSMSKRYKSKSWGALLSVQDQDVDFVLMQTSVDHPSTIKIYANIYLVLP